jgi:hypothetical protein
MNKPHKHATVIHAWVDCAEIEFRIKQAPKWHANIPEHGITDD